MEWRRGRSARALGVAALIALAGCQASDGGAAESATTTATESSVSLPLDGISFDVHRDPG